MMLYVSFEWPSVIAWLMDLRSMARLAARRTRLSYQGDLESHWSSMLTHCGAWMTVGFSVSPGVRCSSSASSPRIEYTMSISPRFNAARRVDSSETTLKTSRFTLGTLRQYPSKASMTSSTPGVKETNLYGPAPTGAFLKASSPTFSTYFFGTIQPAPLALV